MAWYMAAVAMSLGLAKAMGSSGTAQVALVASAGAETYVLFARRDTQSKLRLGGRRVRQTEGWAAGGRRHEKLAHLLCAVVNQYSTKMSMPVLFKAFGENLAAFEYTHARTPARVLRIGGAHLTTTPHTNWLGISCPAKQRAPSVPAAGLRVFGAWFLV
jgi:hypothetical protein